LRNRKKGQVDSGGRKCEILWLWVGSPYHKGGGYGLDGKNLREKKNWKQVVRQKATKDPEKSQSHPGFKKRVPGKGGDSGKKKVPKKNRKRGAG